jgi:hypothetical protein
VVVYCLTFVFYFNLWHNIIQLDYLRKQAHPAFAFGSSITVCVLFEWRLRRVCLWLLLLAAPA